MEIKCGREDSRPILSSRMKNCIDMKTFDLNLISISSFRLKLLFFSVSFTDLIPYFENRNKSILSKSRVVAVCIYLIKIDIYFVIFIWKTSDGFANNKRVVSEKKLNAKITLVTLRTNKWHFRLNQTKNQIISSSVFIYEKVIVISIPN